MKNPKIFVHRNVVMQSIQDAVGHGYTYYVSGSTPVSRLEYSVAVFKLNYQAFADRNEQAKRKRHGLGNVQSKFSYKGDLVYWWLLATPPELGSHPIHSMDKLRNALIKGQRIEIDGFELVLVPKKGTAESKLTWRMTESTFAGFQDNIVSAVRSRSYNRMNQALVALWACPGFNGIRVQIGKLVRIYRAEVKRASIKDAPKPPEKLFYLRRIPHVGISVKQLLSQVITSASNAL